MKVAPKANLKVGFLCVDLVHIAICLWGMIIYWQNYQYIVLNYSHDKLVLITCPLISALGVFIGTLRFTVFVMIFVLVPWKS